MELEGGREGRKEGGREGGREGEREGRKEGPPITVRSCRGCDCSHPSNLQHEYDSFSSSESFMILAHEKVPPPKCHAATLFICTHY